MDGYAELVLRWYPDEDTWGHVLLHEPVPPRYVAEQAAFGFFIVDHATEGRERTSIDWFSCRESAEERAAFLNEVHSCHPVGFVNLTAYPPLLRACRQRGKPRGHGMCELRLPATAAHDYLGPADPLTRVLAAKVASTA